jgi:dienelactone hydrolase
LIGLLLGPGSVDAADTPAKPRIKVVAVEGLPRFGVIGESVKKPAPTLFVIAHSLDVMEQQPVFTEVADRLVEYGFLSIVVEPPCHGDDVKPGEPAQLAGWRSRLEHGEPLVEPFTDKARKILDHLIAAGDADPQWIAAYGTSRGGFLAYHLAAVDPRVRIVAGISPVTELLKVSEFAKISDPQAAERLNVANLADKLVGRAIWLEIGNRDDRVSTDAAIAFTRAVVAAGRKADPKPGALIPVDLLVGPSPGHAKIADTHELLMQWLLKQIPHEVPPPRP